jgi:predicted alpha/beta-fold hydrolase
MSLSDDHSVENDLSYIKDEKDDNINAENDCHRNETSMDTIVASSYEYLKIQSKKLIHPKHFIRQSSSLISEKLPETPSGWMKLLSLLTSCCVGYELRLQKSLTCPPLVYAQLSSQWMNDIYQKMTQTPDSLLRRAIQPSLFVGTRAYAASTAAYLVGGPATSNRFLRFREIMTMPMDGATVALDWELPTGVTEEQVRHGRLHKPVVLVIHGMNNHANFGYVRSMVRACTMRGWIAAGFNMRGCGGLALTTPRGYNAAYTGDIRGVVQQLSARLQGAPLFLVGNSLSASLVTKYLGEEGLCGTLPDCVAGGAALGNPVSIDSRQMSLIFSPLLALGVKKSILEQWSALQQIKEPYFLSCIRRAMLAVTLAEFDSAMAPIMIRNDPVYPFSTRVGFKSECIDYYFEAILA